MSKVIVDDYEGAFKGVAHLVENGCRRIAHIAGPKNLQISENRLRGYEDALIHHGLRVDKSLIVYHDLTLENARECARELFRMRKRPDGVFVVNDPAAIQAIMVAREMHITVPDDVAIVGFSNEPISEFIEPGLTTLAQPLEEIGREALQLLFNRMNEANAPIDHETKILKTSLLVRASSMKKKKPAKLKG